mgnify:CR=1 FL=1|jgi:hypothetical protein|tara:strand:+ start:6711 stop:6998 length:288 start_codon:yes stop_codon:yes gene_type:complete
MTNYTYEGLIQLGFEWEIDFCIYEDYGLVWKSGKPQPTEEECVAAKAEYDANQYQRLRAPEYPPIGDQLDALFHAGVFPADMAAQLQAVKDKYPQ